MKQLIRNILPTTLAAILFAACTDELPVERTQQQYYFDGDYYFVLEDENASMSRVQYDGITHTEFTTGDRIGVFAPQNNDTTQIPNDVFSARDMSTDPPSGPHQVLVPADDEIKKEIPKKENEYLLYFPYTATQSLKGLSNGLMTHTVKEDQREQSSLTASDLLWCHKLMSEEEKEAQYVTIHMHHAMATIVVTVAKDSVDTTHDVILPSMPTQAKGIILRKEEEEVTTDNLLYTVDTEKSRKDISMYKLPDDTDEYNYVYRAVVPACQTLSKDSDILTLYLKDKKGEYVETTYKLAQDVGLRPGKYYTFNLRSGQKPAIPDVGDDDSWVLDVYDPETGQLAGLLCREYLRYQPGNTSLSSPDIRTKRTGNDVYISSQAWVFYNFFPGTDLPNLKEGVVLRFLYDIIGSNSHGVAGDALSNSWPLPHHYGYDGVAAGGLFAAQHGHEWVLNDVDKHGESSKDYTDYYMHGGKILWEQTTNDYGQYYHISSFTIDDNLKIDNITAALNGHIAIPADGSSPYVSYSPIDDSRNKEIDGRIVQYDDENCKVAITKSHVLLDQRDGKAYPLVKIGYNNFWMSKSLRAKTMNNGQKIICRNSTPEQGHNDWIDYDNGTTFIEEPSMLYPHCDELDVYSEHENPDNFPYLYSYYAVKDENFIPPSQDDRLTVIFPTENLFDRTLSYFGWRFAAKLMTSAVSTRSQGSGGAVELETKKEALSNNKIYCPTYNSFACNISGFNLRTNGYILPHNNFIGFGDECAMWLGDNFGQTEGNLKYLRFACYDVFKDASFESILNSSDLGNFPGVEGCSRMFLPVRFLLKFKGQEDSPEISSKVKISSSAKRSPVTSHHHSKEESKVINVKVSKQAKEK